MPAMCGSGCGKCCDKLKHYDYGKDVQLSLRNIADIGNNPYLCSGLLNENDMERVINNDNLTIPTEGTVGYVHVEEINYDGPEIKPQLFDVDTYTFELIS